MLKIRRRKIRMIEIIGIAIILGILMLIVFSKIRENDKNEKTKQE